MKLPVVEVFRSVQGEGPRLGIPTVFIRLGGCNLCCPWCDSMYAHRDWTPELTELDEVLEQVDELAGLDTRMATITGGEPTIHGDMLTVLINRLVSRFELVEVETNGTNAPRNEWLHPRVRWNVSPKFITDAFDPKHLGPWMALARMHNHAPLTHNSVAFKVVVSFREDVEHVLATLPPSMHRLVYLMPLGTTPDEVLAVMRRLTLQSLPVNVTTRLHVLLSLR